LSASPSTEVTRLLLRWSQGDTTAREALVPLVYEELRRVARHCLAGQRLDHTLQSTALVHEAYLRLVGRSTVHWEGRVHFFAVAARLMRSILVDHTRMHLAAKRDAGKVTLLLEDPVASDWKDEIDLIALDDALNCLAALDPRQCEIVECRFFGGLSIDETSQALDISPASVKREWTTARAWLFQQMSHES
jgi:RNA polymerase sigma factor (TIGR02999 family)